MRELSIRSGRSAILEVVRFMSARPQPEFEPVNAIDLAARMGMGSEILAQAIRVDASSLAANPRGQQWQPQLRELVELWQNVVSLFGDEADARAFLFEERPELRGKTPVKYFEEGRPQVVRNLVLAMRESLP